VDIQGSSQSLIAGLIAGLCICNRPTGWPSFKELFKCLLCLHIFMCVCVCMLVQLLLSLSLFLSFFSYNLSLLYIIYIYVCSYTPSIHSSYFSHYSGNAQVFLKKKKKLNNSNFFFFPHFTYTRTHIYM
jgi:hypothetical protein